MNNVSAAGGAATFDTDDFPKAQVVDGSSSNKSTIRLCPELEQFYRAHNLDVSQLLLLDNSSESTTSTSRPWRFVRLNPRFDRAETLTLIEKELLQMHHNNSNENKNSPVKTHSTTTKAPIPVPWLDSKQWGFYALPGNFSLASSPCFRSGRLYGMDISSGASIAALLTKDHDRELQDSDNNDDAPSSADDNCQTELRVLDLCTCPGLKLLTIADYFYQHHQKANVKLIGVDVSSCRMDKCKAIIRKYWVDTTPPTLSSTPIATDDIVLQLYLADGTTFGTPECKNTTMEESLVFDSRVAMEECMEGRGKRKRLNKSARARQKKRLRQIAISEAALLQQTILNNDDDEEEEDQRVPPSLRKFDYVLVDAECSTDGSFKHIRERIKASQGDSTTPHQESNPLLTETNKRADLLALQRKLIESGFRLLKEGGYMVYSTCSLSQEQNENIVSWLLEMNKDAFLVPIHYPSIMKQSKFVKEGLLEGTIRFYPTLGSKEDAATQAPLLGDGFFAAKLGKCKS